MQTPVGFCTGYFRSSSASPSTIASAELGNSCSADDFCWTLKETPEVSQLNLIKLPWWNVNISFRFWFGCVCFFFAVFNPLIFCSTVNISKGLLFGESFGCLPQVSFDFLSFPKLVSETMIFKTCQLHSSALATPWRCLTTRRRLER